MSEHGIVALGDRALRFAIPREVDRRRLLDALRADVHVAEVIFAEDLGAVLPSARASRPALREALTELLTRHARERDPAPAPGGEGEGTPSLSEGANAGVADARTGAGARTAARVIRVVYDGADLADLATQLGVTEEAVVAMHADRDYEVTMLGFMPGFAYLRGLDPRLVVARRRTPRTRVPARSVALAAGYTGIYPFASPGGWHLLGEAVGYTPFHGDRATLALGDRVRFEAVARGPVEAAQARAPEPSLAAPEAEAAARLELTKVLGLALLVDGGRSGHMHEGVPRGGAMLEGALARANLAAGNARGACAIELHGALELVVRGGTVTLGDDSGAARTLEDGDRLAIASGAGARARYIAARGGVAVPVVLGSRGTMLGAGLGGFEGRALRKGDQLPIGDGGESDGGDDDDRGERGDRGGGDRGDGTLPIFQGPDASDDAFRALLATRFVISNASDRTGTRLEAAVPLPPTPLAEAARGATTHRSQPMVVGAIEQTPTGLIVLGRDHPTTGGYPIVAVLATASLDPFFALPPGSHVIFSLAHM